MKKEGGGKSTAPLQKRLAGAGGGAGVAGRQRERRRLVVRSSPASSHSLYSVGRSPVRRTGIEASLGRTRRGRGTKTRRKTSPENLLR